MTYLDQMLSTVEAYEEDPLSRLDGSQLTDAWWMHIYIYIYIYMYRQAIALVDCVTKMSCLVSMIP